MYFVNEHFLFMSARSVLFNVGILPIRCWIWVIHTVYPSTWYLVLGFVHLCFTGNYCHCFLCSNSLLIFFYFSWREREKKKQSWFILANYRIMYLFTSEMNIFSYAKNYQLCPAKMLKKFWLKKYNTIFLFITKKIVYFYWYVNTGIIYYIILYYIINIVKKKERRT